MIYALTFVAGSVVALLGDKVAFRVWRHRRTRRQFEIKGW